jgi:hypothetical protein
MSNKQGVDQSNNKATMAFLAHYEALHLDEVHSASFLRSTFDDDCWTLQFGHSNPFTLDFRIALSDTLTLAQCDQGQLVKLFKMWICSADHGGTSRGVFASSRSKRARVTLTVKLIDYCLLNWQALGLEQNGLRLFNANDMRTLLSELARAHRTTTSIYQWPRRLYAFLLAQIEQTPATVIAQTLSQYPFLSEPVWHLDSDDELEFIDQQLVELGGFTPQNMIRLRAALWHHGLYKRNGTTDFRWGLNTDKIITALYANKTLGRIKCPSPKCLSLLPMERRYREYPAAPIRHQHRTLNIAKIAGFMHVLQGLNSLSADSPSAPLSPLPEVSGASLIDQFNSSRSGRYISAPVKAVLASMRHAIEFYLVYGQAILSSYFELALAAHRVGESILAFSSRQSIAPYLSSTLDDLHVHQWCLNNTQDKFSILRISRRDFFAGYRRAPGLWELLRILYGAIGLVLGVLQARRSSELQQAMADTCLTADLQSFVTVNRKTGLMDINQSITRPIPQVVSQMLVSLQSFQTSLIEAGLLHKPAVILSYPSIFGPLRQLSHVAMNESMDYFCDFFETPRDAEGRRYYFRQHQLRRFFAQIFFWHHDSDSLDVLRWMLGHSDTEMIYHYISDTTPGEVLRQVKSEWGAHMLRQAAPQTDDLKRFLQHKYAVKDFTLLSEEALDTYIEHSLAHRDVTIEPHFIHDDVGTTYKIMVTVHQRPWS